VTDEAKHKSLLVDAVEESVDRIARTDGLVEAWAFLDPESALQQARAIDRRKAAGEETGSLTGYVFGVKDNIDVAGMPTGAGFAPYADRIAREDSAVVAMAKRHGAVVLGKTHLTQYAAVTEPCATRNPWNVERTPGGTSSGSAAAVAAGQVRVALGTQTGGSILRPASYTGVVGFKPTYGLVPSVGVLPTAWSLDHVGFIGQTVQDVRAWMRLFASPGPGEPPTTVQLGVVADQFAQLDDGVRDSHHAALGRLARDGVELVTVQQPWDLDEIRSVWRTIYTYEIATFHQGIFAQHEEAYAPQLTDYISEGRSRSHSDYIAALERRIELGKTFGRLLSDSGVAALVMPTTVDTAPPHTTTGNSYFLSPWSLLGTPTVSLPLRPAVRMGDYGTQMPVGIQLAGAKYADLNLLSVAASVEGILQEPPPA
jgi:aspartyl-tRNA(Asn)/glutamyl-tRNA(Gln) amidotransferase subunit A